MIFIRADANEHIGTGHVMRCLSIACAFADKGEKVLFITADHKGDDLIKQYNFQSICLDSDWNNMESEDIDSVLDKYETKLLLIDSYFVTSDYMSKLNRRVKTSYIDDINADCWDVSYIINYNVFASSLDYTAYNGTSTKLLLGPKYAPLREEFRGLPKHRIKNVTDILISAGGADPERIIEKLIINLCKYWREIKFHFIIGALNSRLRQIKILAEKNQNAILHINERNMSSLMNNCDIAISAAGSTLYELCATGVPTITYTLADNQLIAAKQFEKQEIMLNIGDCRENEEFIERVKIYVQKLIENKSLRKKLSQMMQSIVDGNGVDRIVEELL